MDRCNPSATYASEGRRVLIRPNRSLSPREMVVLFAGMAACAMTLGSSCLLVGAAWYGRDRQADDHS